MCQAAFGEADPGRPGGKGDPADAHRQGQVVPAFGTGGVDEFQVGEHRHRQPDHDEQDHRLRRFHREKHQHHHVPAGREAGKALVLGLHSRVGEIDHRSVADHDDRQPAGPARQQPGFEQRIGRDEHIGQIVDDQIHQHAVIGGPVLLHVVFARQRPVDAVDDQRNHQPEEHQAPFLIDGGQHGEHRQHRAGGGQQMDGQGLQTV